jgi:hypothetical protein
VTDREQPRYAIDHWPEVVVVALVGGPAVNRRADAQPTNRGEILRRKRLLRRGHRRDRIPRFSENAAKRVADRFEDVTTVPRNSCVEEHIVPAQRRLHRFGIALPADGAAFDVRKRKRHRADRQRCVADRSWLWTYAHPSTIRRALAPDHPPRGWARRASFLRARP